MMRWVWPFHWYFALREARRVIDGQARVINSLIQTNRKLQAELLACSYTMHGLTQAYMSTLGTDTAAREAKGLRREVPPQ